MATDSLFSTQIAVGAFDSGYKYATCPLSTLEAALNNSKYVPANATVTKVQLYVNASWWCGGGTLSNGYIKYGFGGTQSINKELLGSTRIEGGANADNAYDYPSGGVDITSYLNNRVAPNVKFKTDNGTYLVFVFQSDNIAKKTYHVKSVKLDITYSAHSHSYTSTIILNPTCTAPGSTQYTCSSGDHSYTDNTIPPALGHSFTNYVSDNNATCTADGTKTAKCDRCSATNTISNSGSALGHNYVPTVVSPTEDSHGYTRYDCTRCGHNYIDENSYTYLVRWYNEDGSKLLETDPSVPYGTMPEYNGTTPTKADTAQYKYEHFGWNISPSADGKIELTPVIANVKYYARFKATAIEYLVEWLDEDGTPLEEADWTPYGDKPSYDGPPPTKPDSSDGKYRYEFLGWSVKDVDDGHYDESDLEPVTGHITYEAVYLPIVKQYSLTLIADDCTVEVEINNVIVEGDVDGYYGYYDYGTFFKVTIIPDFGYEAVGLQFIDPNGTDSAVFPGNELIFMATEDNILKCMCERKATPFFINPEQQVQMVYIVPAINTIVYQVEGDLPTLETKMQSVDDWRFDVINTDIEEKYGLYAYYEAEQLYINKENQPATRVW